MHEMLCFAVQNVSRKMDGEACPADGFETVPVMLGSWSGRPRIGTASPSMVWKGLPFTYHTQTLLKQIGAQCVLFLSQLPSQTC